MFTYTILLFTGFMKGIPKELDEAAIIDGCGYFKRVRSIIFPLLKPVIVTYALTSLVYVWIVNMADRWKEIQPLLGDA